MEHVGCDKGRKNKPNKWLLRQWYCKELSKQKRSCLQQVVGPKIKEKEGESNQLLLSTMTPVEMSCRRRIEQEKATTSRVVNQ